MNKSTIGLFLKKKRTDLGLTQQQLATQSGLSVSLISKLEINDKELTISTLLKLTKVLNLDLHKLAQEYPEINKLLTDDNYKEYLAEREIEEKQHPKVTNNDWLELQGKLNMLTLENKHLKEIIKNQEQIINLQSQLLDKFQNSIHNAILEVEDHVSKEGE